MKGKEKCEFLKGIRKRIAEANGIPYEPRECNYEGECIGTCPFCEKEAAELMEELRKKEAEGADIKFDLLSIETIEAMNESPDIIRDLKQEPFITPDFFADAYEERERLWKKNNKPLRGDIDDEEYWKNRDMKLLQKEEYMTGEIEERKKGEKG